jgi:2-polyprenyl-3-methyl-5-hydroxy-6-metoxy-1,4-benzoquinol methylase
MSGGHILRNCPVCGSDAAEEYLHKQAQDLRLVRCRRCGMIYLNPVRPEFASGRAYERLGAEYYLTPNKLQSDYAAVRFERELRLFRNYCSSGDVLDVGCSTGAFLYQLNHRFPGAYQTIGTDASGPALDYAESRGISLARGNFLEIDFGGRKFDAITFWAVLEHVLEPKRFLEHASSLLKAEGLCLVLVPNMESLAVRLLGQRYRYIYPQHLNYFSRKPLREFAQPQFSILKIHSTHFNPLVIWQDWGRHGAEVSNSERAELLKQTTGYKQNPWLKPARAFYNLTEKTLGALNLADNLTAVMRSTS